MVAGKWTGISMDYEYTNDVLGIRAIISGNCDAISYFGEFRWEVLSV